MRVALLSANARQHDAVGNQLAEKARFFQERGAEVRVFVADARCLHADLQSCCCEIRTPDSDGAAWEYLSQADIIFAVYAQYHDLLQYLPALAGAGPRIVVEYLGVTPVECWPDAPRALLEQSARARGYVWCADHALAASEASRDELLTATGFPAKCATILPLAVDVERFQAERGDRYLHERLGIEGRIALYVGRLAGNKRVPLLIEALARCQTPALHAVIVGAMDDIYAEEAARCRLLAQDLGVAERVHFLGQLDDAALARAYRSADVFVMPSIHEGFCVPVIEAMASGLPVIASRSAALPETVSDAGLAFTPNDADDVARQLRRVLANDVPPLPLYSGAEGRGEGVQNPPPVQHRPRRVAVVSFRFGPDIVGGAETSLRTMAKALKDAGQEIEVFTTCTQSESRWRNDLSAGAVMLDGLTVCRFPIDPHDATEHGRIVRAILTADGRVSSEMEACYLRSSIHSTALIEALRQRQHEFDAIIAGPYLFGLTVDIVRMFPTKTLVAPCFHDEPLSRLSVWPRLYREVAGLLYHSAEEQHFAQARLGVNHPNAHVTGACVAMGAPVQGRATVPTDRPYIVYCGRYSQEKNMPLLLQWARRYQAERPDRLAFVFMGRGEIELPSESWLHDLGHVDESTKQAVLARAGALVQLSQQESLSLVALEAWAAGTPVIVHGDCHVLAGHVERSNGGVAVHDYPSFADALDDLCLNAPAWQERGTQGRAYVARNYASPERYVGTLVTALDRVGTPLAGQMRERGLERARYFARQRWQERFAGFVEQVLTQPARAFREDLHIEPLRQACQAAVGMRTLLLPVRLVNHGTHAAVPDGPGRTALCCEIREAASGRVVVAGAETSLPRLLLPETAQVAALPITLPAEIGAYRVVMWMERLGSASIRNETEVSLMISADSNPPSAAAAFLDTVHQTLPQAHRLQQLPDDYIDVTEGTLAPVKRLVKRKLLNNFKQAYVDVLSQQQSQMNGHVVLMIQQLAECCAMLDHAVAGLHERLEGLEAKMEQTLAALTEKISEPEA